MADAFEPPRRGRDQEHPAAVALVDPALDRIKGEANKRDVPYQSPIKMRLSEKVGWPTCDI